MIFETIICTTKTNGDAHLTPLGYTYEEGRIILAPFVPSSTLENLTNNGTATLNMVDDVRIIAGCLTGRRDWPLVKANKQDGWRLQDTLAHKELRVVELRDDAVRPKFYCEVIFEENHKPFQGFNRAQAAVLEAAILATRLEFLSPIKVKSEITYLNIAVQKTGGERELESWRWLIDLMEAHPNHHGLIQHLENLIP